jgi:hypothetical protein
MSGHSVENVEVLLVSSNDRQSTGRVQVLSWSPPERTRRALKTLGICWGAAIISIMFPVVHFVLVPGFFLGGPIAAFFIWAQESKILGGDCACPSCSSRLQVTKARPRWPISDVCPKCHEAIRIAPRVA